MTSKKNTNKALFSSVIALILCCSMLVGSTFAWFTDEVKSGVNQIVAGNLDVDVLTADNQSIQGIKTLFDDVTLWEPGVVAYENLTVVNKGNLALKYELSVNFTNATEVNGKTLADVLQVGVVPNGIKAGASREEAVAAVQTWQPMKSFIESGELLKQNDSCAYGIVIYWLPSANDNDYNMNNGQTTVLSIDLGVNLHAWQKDAEKDSFDETYDAVVHSEAQLLAALEEGINNPNINVILGGNIQLTGTWTPVGDKDKGEYFTGTLDGKGYTISGLNVEANDYDALISAAKDATIKNLTVAGTVNGVNAAGIVARVEGNTVIENCVSNVAVTGTTKAGGIVCNVTNSGKTVISNCVNNANVNGGDNGIGGLVGYVNNDAYVEIVNCTNNGNVTSDNNKYAGAAVGYAAANSTGMLINMTNNGVITGTILPPASGVDRYLEINGSVALGYCKATNWTSASGVASATELADALTNGGNVILFEDIALGENDSIVIPAGVTATLDLNGCTVSGTSAATGANYNQIDVRGTLTVKNGTITTKHTGTNMGWNNSTNVFNVTAGGVLNITDATIENLGGSDMAFCVHLNNWGEVTLNVENSVLKSSYTAVRVFNSGPNMNNVTIENSTIAAEGTKAFWVHNYTLADFGNNAAKTAAQQALLNFDIFGNGNTYTSSNPARAIEYGFTNAVNYDGNGAQILSAANQTELNSAVNAGEKVSVNLGSGEYTMPNTSADVTITGTEDTVIKVPYKSVYGNGNTITFEGVKVMGETDSGWYSEAFNGATKVVYKDCVIYDQLTTYCDMEFIGCTFYNTFDNDYSVYCYSGSNISFLGCTFNTKCGKAIKVYDEGNGGRTVTVTQCIFDAENYKKAAVEIDSRFSTYYIYINECTLKGAFTEAWNSDAGEDANTNVCMDGTWVKGNAPA